MNTQKRPQFGVHLLETITTGMYSEPLHAIREYVQNAWDSIREARRRGTGTSEKHVIKITVDPINRRLKIADNGTGLSPEEAVVRLVDLGQSGKATTEASAKQNAGFRGIGRMAGISYSRHLRFETSDGSGEATTITFNAASIRERARPGQEPEALDQVIADNYTVEIRSVPTGKRYLEVTLVGINSVESPLLDEQKLQNYLAETAPVPYDKSRWAFGDKISEAAIKAAAPESVEAVEIKLCNPDGITTVDIRRPFSNTLRVYRRNSNTARTVTVKGIAPLPQTGIEPNGWWGWFGVHAREGYLGDTPYTGLRLRRHNIAVGDDSIVRALFKTPHLAKYVFGEVHITDPALVPNSQRDDFEDHPNWTRIKSELKDEASALERAFRRESEERAQNTDRLLNDAARRMRNAKDAMNEKFVSRNEQQKTVSTLEATAKKLEKAAYQRKRGGHEKQRILSHVQEVQEVIEEVQSVRRFRSDDALSHLNGAARKAVRIVLETFKTELQAKEYERIEPLAYHALQPGRKK